MIKFESWLAINNNNNKDNIGSYNKKLDWLYAYSPVTILSDLKKRPLKWLAVALFLS